MTITIEGRRFEVERDGDQYLLTGARGARYRALRRVHQPHMLYLTNSRSWLMGAPKVHLTDKTGKLEVA